MKKITSTLLALVFVFSLSTFAAADGDIPHGGRNCGYEGAPACRSISQPAADKPSTALDALIGYFARLFV